MASEREARRGSYLSLQVPDSVNLVEMSEQEIADYAKKTAARLAESLPDKSRLLDTRGVSLSTGTGADVTVWGAWSRACFKADLGDRGLVVDPDVFVEPLVAAPAIEGRKAVLQLGDRGREVSGRSTRK